MSRNVPFTVACAAGACNLVALAWIASRGRIAEPGGETQWTFPLIAVVVALAFLALVVGAAASLRRSSPASVTWMWVVAHVGLTLLFSLSQGYLHLPEGALLVVAAVTRTASRPHKARGTDV